MNAPAGTENPQSTAGLRAVLEEVAAGRLDPDTAARLVAPPRPGGERPAPGPAPTPAIDASRITRLEVMADALDLRVVADPTIELVHVDGDLELEPDGEVLRLRPPTRSPEGNVYRFGPIGGLVSSWIEGRDHHRVVVRARPDLAVSIAATAGRVDLIGMTGGFNVRMAAGAFSATDVRGAFELDVTSSAAKLAGVFDQGASRVRGTMSTVELAVDPRSDVTITAESEMGSARINGKGEKPRSSSMKESVRTVVGQGSATLDVRMQMGTIKVATR